MTTEVAIQMDSVAEIDIRGDSSFALALEAQSRGMGVWFYEPSGLTVREGRLEAMMRPGKVRDEVGGHVILGDEESREVGTFPVVLMRQDPPFDMSYITATYLLEMVRATTLVVNDPAGVRDMPEKLFALRFGDLMPASVVTRDRSVVAAFRAAVGDIVLKPLHGNGGAGVVRLAARDENLNAVMELLETGWNAPVMAQAYLPAVRDGDKRILLVEGRPAGAVNRRPAEGEVRANFHVGGTAEAAALTARDEEICARLAPELVGRGIIFAGIDVIGGMLTEINVTSPTGIREVARLSGVDAAVAVWDAIEDRLADRRRVSE